MKSLRTLATALAAVLIVIPATANEFVAPAWWSSGDTGTTYQRWDVFGAGTGNLPDVGRVTDGTALPDPLTDALPPAFATSAGNFYSFSGPYSVTTEIPNYGGGLGTHVVVQTAASINPDPNAAGPASIFVDSLRIEDGLGGAITGGANADALQETLITTTLDTGPLGEIDVEWLIWEFYLPGYAGDFQVVSDSIVHSQFRELRVDTALAAAAYPITPVPEPGALLLLTLGGWLVLRSRR